MADEVEKLIRDLNGVPPDLKRKLRPKLRKAGEVVAEDARRRAAWSTRIPKATRVSTSFTLRRPGVSVVVDKKKAPHARPYEHGGQPGTFRHPRWGDRRHWFDQKARPFLAPALAAKNDEAGRLIAAAVDETTRDAGFR
jgi:HK97 gp10 family phage protein